MKKLVSALIFTVIFIFLFSGCEKISPTKEFQPVKSFCVHMKAQKNNKEFEAEIKCNNYESIEISFTAPEELKGFSIETTQDGYSVDVFGIPDEMSQYEINTDSLINILVKSIKLAVFTNHGAFTEKENSVEARLSVDNIPVIVAFSDDGYLLSTEAQNIDFSAVFEKSVDKT